MNAPDRVLIAIDGSERARLAATLAASLPWPTRTQIEIFEVMEPLFPGVETPGPALVQLERLEQKRIEADLAGAAEGFAKSAVAVERVTGSGRAASAIVDEAERRGADLIVMGSRGRGPIASLLLGSVAADVIDHAPCPVLVARTPAVRRMVVADDGSAAAGLALKLACTWPVFRGVQTRAVSVAPAHAITGSGPIMHEGASQMYAELVDGLRARHDLIARDAAAELTASGVLATPDRRFGDPAAEIIASAVESEADLIVLGTRGQSGLERLVLGSVARNVLAHSPMSVLIVPPERRHTRG